MMRTIPLSVPVIHGNAWTYVKECLDTGWVSSVGSFVDRFERDLAAYLGSPFCVAVVNGTAALHVALRIAGVEPDDEVLVSTLTFIAPANAVRYAGAWPVFIDAEPRYWQMDVEKVRDFLRRECKWSAGSLRDRATGRRVKAVLPVHVLGHPVDMTELVQLAREYELAIIEDASESLGAMCSGYPTGRLGDIACFSFNGNKIITTGGGGAIVTDNEAWADRARYLTTQAKDDPVEYIHGEIGYNYRLTNLQAALGCAQLENLDRYVERKREIAKRYRESLSGCPGLTPMEEADWARSTFWLYTVLVNEREYGMDRRELRKRLGENRVETRPLWQPIHKSPAHSPSRLYPGGVAEGIQREALSLPCSVDLTDEEQEHVVRLCLDAQSQ
jgi:perosamine synthetase